jgi:hypothetical protein
MPIAAPTLTRITLTELTPDDIARVTAAADAEGHWSLVTDLDDDGRCYAGLIGLDGGDYEFTFVRARPEGLRMGRLCGEVVSQGL